MADIKYKRKKWTLGIPKVSVISFLAQKFIEEANVKGITLTSLMNKILSERYNLNIEYQVKKQVKKYNFNVTEINTLTVEPKLINLFFLEIIERNLAISHLYNEIFAERYNIDLKKINYEKWKKYLS